MNDYISDLGAGAAVPDKKNMEKRFALQRKNIGARGLEPSAVGFPLRVWLRCRFGTQKRFHLLIDILTF